MMYCHRCDLAFCEEHRDQHADLEGRDQQHVLEDNPAATFCCVCSGLYRKQEP